MVRICRDAVIVIPAPVAQRRVKDRQPFADTPGVCHNTATTGDTGHPHPVPTTIVQTILVADPTFVAAWAASA